MKCLSPITLKHADGLQQLVQCNHCLNCSIRRQLGWTIRLLLERQKHDACSFVTLTYAEENRPGSLRYPDIQLYLKRLRKNSPSPVRFFCTGQYGTRYGREHWHLLLFGVSVEQAAERHEATFGLTRFLENQALAPRPTALWPHGGSHIVPVNEQRARYAARYSLKTGPRGDENLVNMSRKPGIGLERIREIGVWMGDSHPELETLPSWWRVGKSLYSLDASSKTALQEAYEGAGGVIKHHPSKLVYHSHARLYAFAGDLMQEKNTLPKVEALARKELEHGTF